MATKVQPKKSSTTISALTARTQMGQILKRVSTKNERFIIERRGQPQAVVMGIRDFVETIAPAPDWLKTAWAASEKNGTDKLTMREINAEIAAVRSEAALRRRKQAS